MSTIISREQIQREMQWIINDKRKDEIGFTYIAHMNDYSYFDKALMTDQMKLWRKLAKEGTIVIQEYNHRSPTICGKQFYTFVLQNADLESNPLIDRVGFAFDDGAFLVSGHIYCFRKQENRDSIYKYVMGIK
jgi:hypothetical protein